MATDDIEVTLTLDAETLARIARVAEMLHLTPEAWMEQHLGFAVARPPEVLGPQLAERVARLHAPVESWPRMELRMMRLATAQA